MDQGTGDRGPLLLTAGERRRQLVRLRAKADHGERPVDCRSDPPARRPGHLERERHVLADRARRQELEVLEDDADLAAQLGHLPARHAGEIPAVEDHLAARGELVPDEQLEEGGLAGAGRPDEEHELPLAQAQVDVVEGGLAVRVDLADTAQGENRVGPRRAAPWLRRPASDRARRQAGGWSRSSRPVEATTRPDDPSVHARGALPGGPGSPAGGPGPAGPVLAAPGRDARRVTRRTAHPPLQDRQGDRHVALEVGERAVPADERREVLQAEARREQRR